MDGALGVMDGALGVMDGATGDWQTWDLAVHEAAHAVIAWRNGIELLKPGIWIDTKEEKGECPRKRLIYPTTKDSYKSCNQVNIPYYKSKFDEYFKIMVLAEMETSLAGIGAREVQHSRELHLTTYQEHISEKGWEMEPISFKTQTPILEPISFKIQAPIKDIVLSELYRHDIEPIVFLYGQLVGMPVDREWLADSEDFSNFYSRVLRLIIERQMWYVIEMFARILIHKNGSGQVVPPDEAKAIMEILKPIPSVYQHAIKTGIMP